MATIRKRNERYQVQIRRTGLPALTRTFIRRSDAQEWARQMETEADRYGLHANINTLGKDTFGTVLRRYLAEIVPTKRSADTDRRIVNRVLAMQLGKVALSNLTPALFAAYRDERLSVVAGPTVRREMAVLRHCIEVARRDWDYPIPSNPVRLVRVPAESKPRSRRLHRDESAKLLECMSGATMSYLRPFLLLALETGMRRGELLSVKWRDLDVNARTLTIWQTKNGHPRTIPLSPSALAVLADMKRDDERILPVTANAVRLAWRRLRTKAGIPDVRIHDLRHEAISRLFEAGLNVPEVALVSGHRSPSQLFRYTHPRASDIAKKLSRSVT
jgi:integrase